MTERAVKPTEQHRHRAAQIWCEPQHAHKVIDCELAESIAHALAEQPATPPRAEGGVMEVLGLVRLVAQLRCCCSKTFLRDCLSCKAQAILTAHAPTATKEDKP